MGFALRCSTTWKAGLTGTQSGWSGRSIRSFVKRCRGLEGEDPDALETLNAREMIDATAGGIGRGEDAGDRQIDVQITYLHGDLAGVTCICHRYVDLLHLLHMPEGWRIINAAWELR